MPSSTSNTNLKRKISIISGNNNLNILMLGHSIKQIQSSITKNSKELKKRLSVPLPNVEFSKDSIANSKEGNYRVIIVNDILSIPQSFCFNQQSHIIIALYTPTTFGTVWKEDKSCRADAIVEFSDAIELSHIIQDIAMDIQLSHYYQFASDEISDDKELSKAKVNFTDKNLSLNYISLATNCRNGNDYNYDDYIEKWRSFSEFYTPAKRRSINATIDSEIGKMMQSHPQYGQISIKKITELIHDLESGEYILVRTTRKPKNKKMRVKVLAQFGINEWKTGKIIIKPISKFYAYYRYNKYLSVFKFSVK